jgi:hypothetical protein
MHITSTYEKGLAIKSVNSTAKELIDDISRSIATSPARTVESLCSSKYNKVSKPTQYAYCVNDNARKFTYQQRYAQVEIKGQVQSVPTNGVFCTGRYSYVWNSGYALNPTDYKRVTVGGNYQAFINGDSNFRLKKISDFERKLCTQHIESTRYAYDDSPFYTVDWTTQTDVELLDSTDNNLAIYDLAIFSPAIHELTSSAFYSGTFILATIRGGININSVGEFCSDPPDNLDTDFAYCAINKFNFSMRAAGEKTANER